jgi:hypothetical protein
MCADSSLCSISAAVLLLAGLAAAGNVAAYDRSFSEECRQAAAERWIIDVTLEHGELTMDQQLEALSRTATLGERIRRDCEYDWVNKEIVRAAKLGFQPAWIQPQISALIQGARQGSR